MIHIVRGLPGSGKSTFSKSPKFGGMLVIERDQFFVDSNGNYLSDKVEKEYPAARKYMDDMLETAMRNHVHTIVCGVFPQVKSMQRIFDIAEKHNSAVMVWRMMDQFQSVHNVPQPVLESMASHFEDYPPETKVRCSDYVVYPGHQPSTQSEESNHDNTGKDPSPVHGQ